ncbi:DUF5367 family protein [Flagellimonas sp. CMM7]|uniref:DUF5367 family protein n=1 Tax=Flagellimonas sp. CMM7 TaxID=2654676 RepID=UPI0013CFDBD6|nr:DUF5367 family protein [Flagellimonas sp. CMM7]UII78378.1 DUF5367 domain-containing protein [Flagellimonas sp. CMM7]
MKIFRAIGIGALIWILGVSSYALSFYVPIMENVEQQANIVLFVVVMPLVWAGCWMYYKQDSWTHGYKVGQALFLTSAALDALITVPFLIMPNGGSYYDFYTDAGFWVIAFEFIVVAVLYWYAKVYVQKQETI